MRIFEKLLDSNPLNRNTLKNIDKALVFLPLVFAIISITMMISISGGKLTSSYVITQTLAFILGMLAVIILLQMDYKMFQRWELWLYVASIVLIFLPYTPLGIEVYGARSWIKLPGFTFQPSELVKISYTLFVASYLARNKNNLINLKNVLKMMAYSLPIIVFLLKEDFGSAAVFACMWLAMVLYVGIEKKLFKKLVILFVIAMPIAYQFLADYQKSRITAFLYPDDMTNIATQQVYHAKVAMGSAGFFGKGLFQGEQSSLNFLPVKESDFIYAVLVEQLGFVGGALLILLFAYFLYKLYKLIYNTDEIYGALILTSFAGMFTAQSIENIGMCMGLLPVTGITLPFISYGGSSVLASMIAVGFILNIAIANRGITFADEQFVRRSKRQRRKAARRISEEEYINT